MLVFFPQLNITKTLKLSSLCLSFSLISSQSYADPQALLQNLSGQWQGSTYYAQSEPTKVATQIAANLTPDQGILTFNITYSADGLQNYAVKVMSFDKEAQLLYSSDFHDHNGTLSQAEIIPNQGLSNYTELQQDNLSNGLPFNTDSTLDQQLTIQYQGVYQQRPAKYIEHWQLSATEFTRHTKMCFQDVNDCQYVPLSTSKLTRVTNDSF